MVRNGIVLILEKAIKLCIMITSNPLVGLVNPPIHPTRVAIINPCLRARLWNAAANSGCNNGLLHKTHPTSPQGGGFIPTRPAG